MEVVDAADYAVEALDCCQAAYEDERWEFVVEMSAVDVCGLEVLADLELPVVVK